MKIPLKQVIDALESSSDSVTHYFDLHTGETVSLFDRYMIGETDEELAELLESTPERFLRFPTQYEIHEYRIMEDFIVSLPAGAMQRELAEAIRGKGAFRRFKATIRYYGVEQKWYGFLADAYKAISIQWCKDNQLEYTIDTKN